MTAQTAEDYIRESLPRLMQLAGAVTGNWHEAEDLVQETLAKVVVKWRRVSGSDNVDAYVRRMMMNTYLSGKRRRASTEVVSHEVATTHPRQSFTGGQSQIDDRSTVLVLLNQLPPRQRAVIALRFLEDYSDERIADVLEVSRGSVATAAHRGLARLRELAAAQMVE